MNKVSVVIPMYYEEEVAEICYDRVSTVLRKLSDKYEYVEHNGKKLTYKCYRVFASKNPNDGEILKCKHAKRKIKIDSGYDVDETYLKKDKFGLTPDHCFVENSDVREMSLPEVLDKQWYIDLAKKRLGDYGICVK